MVISSVSSRNQQVGCCNFSSCQKLKTFLVACWPGDPNYCWDWNFFVALLLMEKNPAITSWYLDIFGEYLSIYSFFLHPRWLFGISEPSTVFVMFDGSWGWDLPWSACQGTTGASCRGLWEFGGPRTASFLYLMLSWCKLICKLMFFSLQPNFGATNYQGINLLSLHFCVFFLGYFVPTPRNETPIAVAPYIRWMFLPIDRCFRGALNLLVASVLHRCHPPWGES